MGVRQEGSNVLFSFDVLPKIPQKNNKEDRADVMLDNRHVLFYIIYA